MMEITAEALALQSSVADEAIFIPDLGILQVRFKSGKVYRYEADLDIWAAVKSTVENGESFGKLFNKMVRQLPTWKKVRA